jgi:hypothetical protein
MDICINYVVVVNQDLLCSEFGKERHVTEHLVDINVKKENEEQLLSTPSADCGHR